MEDAALPLHACSAGKEGRCVALSEVYLYLAISLAPIASVSRPFVLDGSYELEVATERVPASVHLGALFDPKMTRIKC